MSRYKQTLSQLAATETAHDLDGRILSKIAKFDTRQARMRTWLYGALSVISLFFVVITAQYAMSDLAQSGFFEYVSLVFTDGALYTSSKELLFSIAESLPAVSVAVGLAIVGTLGWSLANAFDSYKNIYNHHVFQRS